MVQTALLRLMTWNRTHPALFPFGSSIFPLIITVLIIEIPTAVITYSILHRSFYPLPLVASLMLINLFTLSMLFRCVYTDPGIIGQIVDKYEREEEHALIPSKNHLNLSEHKYVMTTQGLNVYQKYCVECCIYRPLRTIHCQICNHCVQRYDHHCPWLGVCIAKFNYRYFFLFIVGLTTLSASITAVSLLIIFTLVSAFPVKSYLLQILVAVTAGVLFLPIFKLLTYHIKLFYNRQTTNQDLKDLYNIINVEPPFQRCEGHKRKAKIDLKANLYLSSSITEKSRSEQDKSTKESMNKGTRYSTLVSDRQSVLNSLVQTEL